MRLGTFIKTPAPHVVEILGMSGLDFGLIDAEHGPFDRGNVDIMMLAGKAANWPLLVRTPDDAAATMLWALDLGAAGLVIPHVDTPEQAARIVRQARFGPHGRGFSSSPRGAGYGRAGFAGARELGDTAEIFCQIESPEAVSNVTAIVATTGVTGVLVGRADLAIAMDRDSPAHPDVAEATHHTIAATVDQGKVAAVAVGTVAEIARYAGMGATMFIVSSDQSLLASGAQSIADCRATMNAEEPVL